MNYPRITIITPSYNQGQFLESCILSIINQNYPNLEYILIDGASTDNSLEIIKKYEKHLSYWLSEPDMGQSAAINKGLKIATGEIINWLNADDYYEKDTLFTVAKSFNNDMEVLCGRCKVFRNDKETAYLTQGTDIYPENIPKTIGWARTDQPATFYRRPAIEKMGLLDEDLHYLMDRDWWIKYVSAFGLQKVVKIPDMLVNFRLHANSKTIAQSDKFQLDRDTYYFALASQYHFSDFVDFILQNTVINKNYRIKNLQTTQTDWVQKALNYYILLRANELYAANHNTKAQEYLNFVKVNFLEKEDKQLWNKLNFRNKYIPNFMLPWLRKIKLYLDFHSK